MRRFDFVVVAACVALLAFAGCAAQTPEERVAAERSRYTATLNAFIVKEVPLPEQLEPVADEAEDEVEGEPAGEGEGEPAAPVPVRQDVELDLIVQHDSNEPLPGITVDVSMVGPDEVEKAHWRIWVDTAGLPKANQMAVSHLLEDVDYVEGDGFYAEVRHPVPPGERGDYREFSAP